MVSVFIFIHHVYAKSAATLEFGISVVNAPVVQLDIVIHIKNSCSNFKVKKPSTKGRKIEKRKVIIFVTLQSNLAHSVFYQEFSTKEFCLSM